MKDKIEQIKAKQERLAELLDEYRKSVESEGKLYHIFEDEEVNRKDNWTDTYLCECGKTAKRWLYDIPDYKYYLANLITKDILCYGGKQRLKSYMRINDIKDADVLIDVRNFGSW